MAELPVLTGKALLDITQRVVAGMLRKQMSDDAARNFRTRDVKVTCADIEVVGDALKFDHLYVPMCTYREAMELAGLVKPRNV
jgi:hypothetical protein